MRSTEKKLIRYMRGRNDVLWSVIYLVLGCLMVGFDSEKIEKFVFCLIIFVVLLFLSSIRSIFFRLDIREARKTGEMREYIDDFSKGVYCIDKDLCLGEKYLFARGAGIPIPYGDIQVAYLDPGAREGEMLEIDICVLRKDGNATILCTTRVNSEKNEEVNKLIETLKIIGEKNPEIRLTIAK